jgi:type IV secretory pathway TrbD component
VSAAVVTTVGAVALFVAGRRAYVEQTVEASWRCHVTRVVVTVSVAAVVTIATLLVGFPFGLVLGAVALPMRYSSARAVPRFDHLAAAWGVVVVGACCAILAVVALTADDLSGTQSASWIASGVFVLVWSAVAVHQFRAAARAPLR